MQRPDYYGEMTSRNIGVISEEEQEVLRNSTIVIAGCGCMGALAADLLARFGVGSLRIADPDIFEISNINRQFTARHSTVGKNKAEVLGDWLKDINPKIELNVYNVPITDKNVAEFLKGADYIIDGIDFYNFYDALTLHREAEKNGQFVSLAVAIGFGANVFTFNPNGMKFEEYLGFTGQDNFSILPEKYCPYFPAYADIKILEIIRQKNTYIPSIGIAQALGNSMLITEIIGFLLKKKVIIEVPNLLSIDLMDMIIKTT